ncbi:MAG TPA: hypothetical protein VHG89_02700 [Verrucomicrobiae bacterium]|nr:hypothetical protein [Verrucomicrobiae bacterium]
MTDEELSKLPAYHWMPSRIPLRDALAAFVPNASKPEPIMEEMSKRCGESVWYVVEGGHRVLFLYDGGTFDNSRFTLEPKAWDHEHCSVCQEHIPAMTLCYVTKPQQPYILLCSVCYERYVTSKQSVD